MRAKETRTRGFGRVQAKVLRMCEMKPGTEVLLKAKEIAAARRLARRGLVVVIPDYFGTWCKVVTV